MADNRQSCAGCRLWERQTIVTFASFINQNIMTNYKSIFKYFLFASLYVLSACSSDDDGDNGSGSGSGSGSNSSITINLDGVSAKLNNVYWTAESNGDGTNFYEIQFYSFDMYSAMASGDMSAFPSNYSAVLVSFDTAGSLSELPEGSFAEGSYEVSGAVGCSINNPEGKYYIEEGPSSGNLVITKNGDKYTVSISPLEMIYYDPNNSGSDDWKSINTQWNFTGKIRKAPEM